MKLRLALLVASLASVASAADNWPQWRGPQSNGVAAPGNYPVKFSADEGLAWKIALPGRGMSTPAVWGDHIILTCGIDGKDGVVAYNFTGDELWRGQFGDERAGKHQNGSGSNPSPATDGKHVVVAYKSGTIACLNLDGKVLWTKSLQAFTKDKLWWDMGNSPVIAGDRAVIAVMQTGESYLAAYDLETGNQAWQEKRQYDRPAESDQSYTTPQVATVGDREVLVTFGADHLTGHDAETGKLLWDLDGFNPRDEANWRVIASPAIGGDVAVVPYGRTRFVAGVRISGTPEKIWELGSAEGTGADVPTPVTQGDVGYVLTDRGRVRCINLTTGDEQWQGNLPGSGAKYYASPVLAGDKLYCAREDGMVFVADVADGFKLLGENDMGEKIIATPVPIRDGLLIRGEEHLFRIGGSAAPPDSQTAG